MNKRLEWITLAGVASLAALPLFLNPGFLNTRGGGDSPFLLFRLHQLYSALTQGVFPVRWMPDAAFGLGYPFFNYYATLPFYLAALFKFFGASYVLALKLTHLSGFWLAAFGMYGWLRAAGVNRSAAWLAAVAYTFAPFHLVNVYVRGDSLGEFWAFALYPLCLWAAQPLRNNQLPITNNFRNRLLVIGYSSVPLALAYAALIFTHNISALIFSPFLGLYLFASLFASPNTQPTSRFTFDVSRSLLFIVYCSLAIALGLALSAFYWLPALRETGFAQLGSQTTGFFFYGNHFRGLNLIQPSLLFNYDVGSSTTTPFAMGLAQTILLGIAILVVVYRVLQAIRKRDEASSFILHPSSFLLFGLALSTFMLTRFSAPLWANLPLLSFSQFPWRFLSVQSLFASALIGLAGQFSIPNSKFTISLVVLCIANCALSILGLRPDFVPITDADVTAERLQTYEYFTGNIGTTIRNEYLPRWTQPRPYSSEEYIFGTASLKVLTGEAGGERLEKRAASQTWAVNVNSGSARVAVPLLYWPGWQARADGKPLDVTPADGLGWASFDLPRGEHQVELKLGNTPTRRNASLISIIALLVTVALAQPWNRLKTTFVFFASSRLKLSGLLILLIILALAGRWLNAQAKPSGAATMDFDQLGYLHAAPVKFGNFDILQSYNYSAETLRPGETLAVSLLWQASGNATFTLDLVSPAGHLLNLPHTIAQTSGPAKDYTVAALRLPDTLPTGVYLLRLSLIQDNLLAPALTSGSQPRGAIYLRPIRVVGAIREAYRDVPFTQLTPALGLGAVTASQTDSSSVTVTLNWQAIAPIPANYMLALRLRDSTGAELAALDVQPTGGIYPTSIWRLGEVVADQYQLALPSGLIPSEYPLTITLYDAATLAPAGTATLPITLTQWSPPPGTEPLHQFNQAIALHNVTLPGLVKAGDALAFTARWIALAPPQELEVRWSVVGLNGQVTTFADLSLAAKPSSEWAVGALVAGHPSFIIPVNTAPGNYKIEVQLLDAAGKPISPSVSVGNLLVAASDRTATLPPMQFEANAQFGPIKLAGYDAALTPATLTLTLHRQASGPAEADYKYFVHILNPEDESIPAQADGFPTVPTSQWFENEAVSQMVTISLADLAPGVVYNIGVGWYDPATGNRLGERAILSQGVVKP
ncbi:MAG: hypothetical protein HYZ49_04175 [Chloroflexi bacterium]|nr:hypothetical protein [Chloroflexota bacterium]